MTSGPALFILDHQGSRFFERRQPAILAGRALLSRRSPYSHSAPAVISTPPMIAKKIGK